MLTIFGLKGRLIYFTICFFYSLSFKFIIWFMVLWERIYFLAIIRTKKCSAIPNISNVTIRIDYQGNNCTASWFLYWIPTLSIFEKLIFSFLKAYFQSINWLFREIGIFSDLNHSIKYIFMKIILQIVRAAISTMSIKHPKITTFRPMPLMLGFGNVHDYRNSIFIIFFDKTMKGVDWISYNSGIRLIDKGSRLEWIKSELLLKSVHFLNC